MGPTSILSLLVASNAAAVNGKTDISDALFFAFFSGLIQLTMGLFRLGLNFIDSLCVSALLIPITGFLVDFISEPVISAFMSSAALTIGASQLKVCLYRRFLCRK